MMNRIMIIGDIHGCFRTFEKMIFSELKLQKKDVLVCLGDLIDRGPDSKHVVDLIIHLRKEGYTIHILRGNHEQMMMDSSNGMQHKNKWLENGGDKTLASFSVDNYMNMAPEYQTFFKETLDYLVIENYIFVHAGLNLRIENPFEDRTAMLWTRRTTNLNSLAGRTLIHGHTPIVIDQILKQTDYPIINLDGGCVYRDKTGMGNLVAYILPEAKFVAIRNIE